MIKLCNSENCTACGACIASCPKTCISFQQNEFGILYPQVDSEKCVGCKSCINVCPVMNKSEFSLPKRAYAVWSLDNEDRKSSSSGGLASVIYNTVISEGGIGYGVFFNERMNAVIDRSSSTTDCLKFKGSKYVHADSTESYKKVKQDLQSGKNIVYIGTPCQIDALKHYLGKEYNNLYIVDLVCHGTPPYSYLEKYISEVTRKKIDNVKFRNENEYFMMLLSDGKKSYSKNGKIDVYITAFRNSLFYSDYCYKCKYAQNKRVSDITIGDFWGLGEKEPFDHPYTGAISLALINTDKGRELFEHCRNKLFAEERTVAEALEGNAQLNSPPIKHKNYDRFRNLYNTCGVKKAAKACLQEELSTQKKEYNRMMLHSNLRKLAGVFIKKYRN